jgi:hypothetical protein
MKIFFPQGTRESLSMGQGVAAKVRKDADWPTREGRRENVFAD